MINIHKAQVVEVETRDGKLWVNVDGVCTLRIGEIENLTVRHPDDLYIAEITDSGIRVDGFINIEKLVDVIRENSDT